MIIYLSSLSGSNSLHGLSAREKVFEAAKIQHQRFDLFECLLLLEFSSSVEAHFSANADMINKMIKQTPKTQNIKHLIDLLAKVIEVHRLQPGRRRGLTKIHFHATLGKYFVKIILRVIQKTRCFHEIFVKNFVKVTFLLNKELYCKLISR